MNDKLECSPDLERGLFLFEILNTIFIYYLLSLLIPEKSYFQTKVKYLTGRFPANGLVQVLIVKFVSNKSWQSHGA